MSNYLDDMSKPGDHGLIQIVKSASRALRQSNSSDHDKIIEKHTALFYEYCKAYNVGTWPKDVKEEELAVHPSAWKVVKFCTRGESPYEGSIPQQTSETRTVLGKLVDWIF